MFLHLHNNYTLCSCECFAGVLMLLVYRVIKLSSPYLNILIVIGAVLFYGDVILLGIDTGYVSETTANILCMVRLLDTYYVVFIRHIIIHVSMLKVIPERLNSV